MKTMTKACLSILLLAAFSMAKAEEDPGLRPLMAEDYLATITNDRDHDVSQLNAVTDAQGHFLGIDFTTTSDRDPRLTKKFYSVADISSAQGAVLRTESGHNVVILKGVINPQTGSTNTIVQFLTNGLTNAYDQCPVWLNRGSSGAWEIENAYTQRPVTQLFVQTWSLGVTTVQGICNK